MTVAPAYTADARSLEPARQAALRDAGEWACLCAGEIRPGDHGGFRWLHSASCVMRRADGSRPRFAEPYAPMREPEPPGFTGEDPGEPPPLAPPARRTRAERQVAADWAARARASGMGYPEIAAGLGMSVPGAWRLVNKPAAR